MGDFLLNSFLLGVGLAMDAFSVSLASGLAEPDMKPSRMLGIPGVFGGFQFLMPMIGWICVHTVVSCFTKLEKFIPWVALILLLFIGGKMLIEGFRGGSESQTAGMSVRTLLVMGVATSIDALSVGFAIAEYGLGRALLCAAIIGVVTFVICVAGIVLGRKIGTRLAGKASILGGIILIAIGIEIFVKGVF